MDISAELQSRYKQKIMVELSLIISELRCLCFVVKHFFQWSQIFHFVFGGWCRCRPYWVSGEALCSSLLIFNWEMWLRIKPLAMRYLVLVELVFSLLPLVRAQLTAQYTFSFLFFPLLQSSFLSMSPKRLFFFYHCGVISRYGHDLCFFRQGQMSSPSCSLQSFICRFSKVKESGDAEDFERSLCLF